MNDTPRSAELLSALLKGTPGLIDLVKTDPSALDRLTETVTKHMPPPAFLRDTLIYRTVVIALGSVAVIAVGGGLTLAILGGGVPDIMTALGSAAIGAMAGLLAPSPKV
jgi:hypothetical protein